MTSSSDTFGRLKLVAVSSAADKTPTAELYKAALSLFHRANCEVSEVHLPHTKLNACDGCYASGGRTCLFPCDYNDIDEEIYDPADKGVVVHEKLNNCDLLLVVAESRCGAADSLTQRFLERLIPYENLERVHNRRALEGKVAVVFVVGDSADSALGQVTARLSSLGFAIASYGTVSVEVPAHGPQRDGLRIIQGSSDVQRRLQASVDSATKQAAAHKRR